MAGRLGGYLEDMADDNEVREQELVAPGWEIGSMVDQAAELEGVPRLCLVAGRLTIDGGREQVTAFTARFQGFQRSGTARSRPVALASGKIVVAPVRSRQRRGTVFACSAPVCLAYPMC